MVPYKQCNCNCVYCECGSNPPVSSERKIHIPAKVLIDELNGFLKVNQPPDYITFAGSGEPTLNSDLGKVISFVKEDFPGIKTALLTNGTLLNIPEVRNAIALCDLVLPSLDAASESVLRKINRPHQDVHLQQIIDGLITFSDMYTGLLWVEVFIVPGINDTDEEIGRFKEVLTCVQPSRIQLNSLDRPGACAWVKTASPEMLLRIADELQPLPVEIISRKAVNHKCAFPTPENLDTTILHLLRRRPETVEKISVFCNSTIDQIQPVLQKLVEEEICRETEVDGRIYYSGIHPESTDESSGQD
jgi:wyosine [tRNA(Phe)-imidazoG37] synthetase (radical SAM superfamily)